MNTAEAGTIGSGLLEQLGVTPRILIDGNWSAGAAGETFAVTDPGSDTLVTEVADAGPEDALDALGAAVRAQPSWAATPARERAELLRRLFDAVAGNRESLARLIALESGKAMPEAGAEVDYGGEFLRWYSEEAAHIRGSYAASPAGGSRFVVQRRPVGPCLMVTPWNFPLAMVTRKLAPALAAGCTVLVKPPKQAPLTALAFAGLALEAGVPAGVLNVLPTSRSAPLVSTLTGDPRLRKLSFTGSTEVGRELLKAASDHLIRTSMELGGNAALIVFADADLDLAVKESVIAKMRNAGESCIAANRIYVEAPIAKEFTERFVAELDGLSLGHPLEGADVGPLIDSEAVERVEALVREAVADGATLALGGESLPEPGNYFRPTVLTGVPAGARVLRDEIFGPVAPIQAFTSEDEVIRLANGTPFGLAAYVFTSDLQRSWRLADALESGMVGINRGVISNVAAPFGGLKASGLGREGGPEGLDSYLEDTYVLFGDDRP